jgi:hypothetical protein
MLHALVTFAAETAGHTVEHSSKTAFYIAGGALAVWAVVLSAIGLTQPEFPANESAKRGVIALSSVLVLLAMITAIVTA